MTHPQCRRSSRTRRSGQVLLIAVLLMIVIAVIGSTFAALMFSVSLRPAPLIPTTEHRQIIAWVAPTPPSASA